MEEPLLPHYWQELFIGISTACSAGLVGYFCTQAVLRADFFRLFDGFVNYLLQCRLTFDFSAILHGWDVAEVDLNAESARTARAPSW